MARLSGTLNTALAAIAWFLLALGFLLALPILLDATVWLLPALVVVAALLGLLVALIRRRFNHGTLPRMWATGTLVLIGLLAVTLAAPIYYLAVVTALRPPTLPQVVLTNGSKTVTFQGMIHIGSEPFYKAVFYDLERALADDAVIYYEGVRPDKEGDAWLRQMVTGDQDLGDIYAGFARSCGLVFQNDVLQLLGRDMLARPDRHVVADVSTLDMKREFDRLMASDAEFAAAMKPRLTAQGASTQTLGDGPLSSFVAWQKRGTPGQKALAGTVCRGLMSKVQDSSSHPKKEADPLDRVLLDFRNRALASRIVAEPRSKIFITYGAAHLPGVYRLLQSSDAAWRVVSVKWIRTIDPPDTSSGTLNLSP